MSIKSVYRDWNTDGDPTSGEHEPDKEEIRALLTSIAGGTSAVGDYRGTWSGVANYIATDIAQDGGSLWYALVPNTNIAPVEGATWTLFLPGVGVSDGDKGDIVISSGVWIIKGQYRTSLYGGSIAAAMAAADADGGGTVEVDTHGTIVAPEALLIPSGVDLVGLGDTIVDVSGMATGDLDGLYAVKKDGAGLTTLGSFTGILAMDEHITFAGTPDVNIGQIICIYDSANGSFLPLTDGFAGRDYYRRGQRARVVAKSGNTIYLDQAIRAAYASGGTTTVYKQDSTTGRIGGIRFDATGYVTAGNRVFRAKYGDRLRLEDCDFIGGAYVSCEIDQCYETTISRGAFETDLATASGNSYPLSILNSAHTQARGFAARGKWNGIGTGGGDEIGAIQSYDTLFEDFRSAGTDAPGVDMHGNSELTRMVRGLIDNGISFGGKDTYYTDCHVTDKDYLYALLWAEIWGGDQNFVGGSIKVTRTSYSGRYNIDAFGGAAFRAAQADTNIKIHTRIEAPLAARLMGLRLDAAVNRVNFDIDLKLSDVGSLVTPVEIYRDAASSNGTYARWRFSGVPGSVADPITLSGTNAYSAATTIERGITVE